MSDGDLEVNTRVIIPHWELTFSASRSGGPGGQHVNTTSSRISLNWCLHSTCALTKFQKERVLRRLASRLTKDGILQIHVEDTRSNHRNKELAKERLKALLNEALTIPKRRRATKPSKASKRRRVDTKKARGSIKKLRQKPPRE